MDLFNGLEKITQIFERPYRIYLQAENAILKEVRNNFPKDNILSEEAGKDDVEEKEGDRDV